MCNENENTAGADPIALFADRTALMGLGRRRFGTVTLPMSGLVVRYRSLTEAEWSQYQQSMYRQLDDGSTETDPAQAPFYTARLICYCVCDADGKPILRPSVKSDDGKTWIAGDEEHVKGWDAEDVSALDDALQVHLGIANRAKRAKVEELAKNS